jgi:hypothetical protein
MDALKRLADRFDELAASRERDETDSNRT